MFFLFVGGTFDDNGGRPSSVVDKFFNAMCRDENIRNPQYPTLKFGVTEDGDTFHCVNGGSFEFLKEILSESEYYNCVIWWANVPNDKPKLRDVKAINPKPILVTSKRNDNNKYSFQELINRALNIKANLTVEFSKSNDGQFKMMLFDPLGNCWHEGYDINECARAMLTRIKYLASISRKGCTPIEDGIVYEASDNPAFFELIKNYAEKLHELIMPAEGVTRFLGNTSFRCMRGFPSFRDDDIIYVSRRNVDKRYIDRDSFVPTKYDPITGSVYYYGEHKPSVDTPIQLALYILLPNINYMFHSHVYIERAPFTNTMVPCGGLQEIAEIMDVVHSYYGGCHSTYYAINLIGHGSIVMCNDVEQLKNIPFKRRPMPETHKKE